MSFYAFKHSKCSRDSGQNLQPSRIITEINIAFAKSTLSDMLTFRLLNRLL